MRAALVVVVLAVAAVLVVLPGEDSPPPAVTEVAAAPGTAVVRCKDRIEQPGPDEAPGASSVVLPEITFWGLRRAARAPVREQPYWKAAVDVRAPVTLKVADHHRGLVALTYGGGRRGAPIVRFEPCPPNTPGFSGGTVGPATSFAGGFQVRRPACVTLAVERGGRSRQLQVGFGVRC
jgi:hypothetical protein